MVKIKESIVVMDFNESNVKIPIRLEGDYLEISIGKNKSHSTTMSIKGRINDEDIITLRHFISYIKTNVLIDVGGIEYRLDSKLEDWNREYHNNILDFYGENLYETVKDLYDSQGVENTKLSEEFKGYSLVKDTNNTVIGNSRLSGMHTIKVNYSLYANSETNLKAISIKGSHFGTVINIELIIRLEDFKSKSKLEDKVIEYINIELPEEVKHIDAELYEAINMVKTSVINLLYQQKEEIKEVIKTKYRAIDLM